ncbi:MAG: hypothetical protein QOH21_2387, partial [Acidobacteriota bacterium]|nr:hypothetical protein [Acidobacteriota bacterium]
MRVGRHACGVCTAPLPHRSLATLGMTSLRRKLHLLMKTTLAFTLLVTLAASAADTPKIPAGYWPVEKSREILAKTETIRLAPDLSTLTKGEQAALGELIQVGFIFQKLYEEQRHYQAVPAYQQLVDLDRKLGSPEQTRNLLELYRLFQGPIATTLDNRREAFLPVDPQIPAR